MKIKTNKMTKTDNYFVSTLKELLDEGNWDRNPRPKWKDKTPAYSKYITQKYFKYNILKNEFPIVTLKNTPLKSAFHDIEAIYIKQTNIIEEMHPSIRSWWIDFAVTKNRRQDNSLGQTYGAIVRKYKLMDKLLKGLENNPFSRRHIIDLWQYSDQITNPKSLVPCAFQTLWSVIEKENTRYINLTLTQRSMDYLVTNSINSIQYVMLGMMVCNHLSYYTKIKHKLNNFSHFIQNVHIYDRHIPTAGYILENRKPKVQPTISLDTQEKDFYEHKVEDFVFHNRPKNEKDKLEIAI